jgi:hypothetical protein
VAGREVAGVGGVVKEGEPETEGGGDGEADVEGSSEAESYEDVEDASERRWPCANRKRSDTLI